MIILNYLLIQNPFIMETAHALIDDGEGLADTWTSLAFQEPPDDFFGRILWSLGLIGQLIISFFTFPAALALFLLEEAMQTYGMGAYMLQTAGEYEESRDYLENYLKFINACYTGAKTLALLSPITGGAVLMYTEAAKVSQDAFVKANEANLLKQAEKDERIRQRLVDDAYYGKLILRSTPSNAEIWLNGENTELLTPETFKRIEQKEYLIELRYYDKKVEEWQIYGFWTKVFPGKKKEIYIHLPPGITGDGEIDPPAGTSRLSIYSNPSYAEIYINNENTGLLTPETFKNMNPNPYGIKVRAFNKKRQEWDEHEIFLELFPNTKTEIKINIPAKTSEQEEEPDPVEEDEEPQLPNVMKAEVTGDYAVDGDTFQTTEGERIRVMGIDTPEMGQPWSQEAKEYLHELIGGKKVYLKIWTDNPIDVYGRTLATCTTSRGTPAYLILIAGLARVFIADDAQYDPAYYYTAEQIAKDRKVGIWTELP